MFPLVDGAAFNIFFWARSNLNSFVVTKLLHLVIIRLSDSLIAFLASVRNGFDLLIALD
jgi:hypothetical protein